MATAAPAIIVKKKRHGKHGHHGGAWKVAYADFVTAMMAFFLVMWLVGQSQAVRSGVAGYFRKPSALEGQGASGILPGHTAGFEADGPTPKEVGSMHSDLASLQKAAEHIREQIAKNPAFKALAGQIQINATAEGLRIELIDSGSATFFDTASAVLKPATEQVLAVIAKELDALGRPLVIEGHTDSRVYSNNGDRYANWELSTDRANAARRQMERSGLRPELVQAVRGFADRQLANPKDAFDPKNRRVSILVPNALQPQQVQKEGASETPAPPASTEANGH